MMQCMKKLFEENQALRPTQKGTATDARTLNSTLSNMIFPYFADIVLHLMHVWELYMWYVGDVSIVIK